MSMNVIGQGNGNATEGGKEAMTQYQSTESASGMNLAEEDITTEYGPLSLEQTQALYVINKDAKAMRDEAQAIYTLRNIVKSQLFEGETLNPTEEQERILAEKYGIDRFFFSEDPLEDASELTVVWEPGFKNYISIVEQQGFIDVLYENEACGSGDEVIEAVRSLEISPYSSREDIMLLTDQNELINRIQEAQTVVRKQISELELEYINKLGADRMHEFLWESGCEKDDLESGKRLLYQLKSAVLIRSGEKPSAYHVMEHSGGLLAYYEINGFKFHMPIDQASLDEEEKARISDDVAIGMIDAERRDDFHVDAEGAIRILLDYLGLGDISADEYLKGNCDLEDLLDIDIYE